VNFTEVSCARLVIDWRASTLGKGHRWRDANGFLKEDKKNRWEELLAGMPEGNTACMNSRCGAFWPPEKLFYMSKYDLLLCETCCVHFSSTSEILVRVKAMFYGGFSEAKKPATERSDAQEDPACENPGCSNKRSDFPAGQRYPVVYNQASGENWSATCRMWFLRHQKRMTPKGTAELDVWSAATKMREAQGLRDSWLWQHRLF